MCRRREDVPVADGDQGRRADAGHVLQRGVAQNRLGLVAKRVHGLRMGVFGGLPLELDEDLRLLGVEARREHPQPDLARQLEHARRTCDGLPAADQSRRVGVGLPPRTVDDERADDGGVPHRDLLHDHAAHRSPDDVRAVDSQMTEQRHGDVGEERGGVRAAGPLRLTDPRVVEDDDAERLLQVLGLERPRRVVGAEPVDEQDRVAGAVLLVEDAALAEFSVRQREASACGGSGVPAGRARRPCRARG